MTNQIDWLTFAIGVALIGLGIFYYRRADLSADETAGRAWQLSPTASAPWRW